MSYYSIHERLLTSDLKVEMVMASMPYCWRFMALYFENVVMRIVIQHMFVMINKIMARMLHHNIQQELLLRTILSEKIILIMLTELSAE